MITHEGREAVDEAWPAHNGAEWSDISRPGLPHDATEWEVTIVVLALIALTGLTLSAVAELHETGSRPESPRAAVRADARQIVQEAHVTELVREHRRAVMSGPDALE